MRWTVAAVILALGVAAGSTVLWTRAAPPSPAAILEGLRLQHGIALDERPAPRDWDYDGIADEWSGLVLLRGSAPTPVSVELRGWRCALVSQPEVSAGAIVLGTATIALSGGGTLSRRTPDGGFECEVTSISGEGPHTFLMTATPTGTIERFRFHGW